MKDSTKGSIKEWVKDILIAVVIAVVIMQFVKPTIVKQHSMEPTLYENNYIFISKQQYTFGKVKAGDIIVFHTDLRTEDDKEKLLIKRIIAVPGDTIEINQGKVFINDEYIEEPYTLENFTSGNVEKTTIPEGKVFAMGDNRQDSLDSRNGPVGLIDIKQILGKAVIRVYPFKDFGLLK